MGHNIVMLREVQPPAYAAPGTSWMTLADAETAGVDMNGEGDSIGPRRRGVVYRGAYWGDVSTVHDVFVLVAPAGRNPETGRFTPRRVVGWTVAEESASDHGRIRSHCTSWAYDRRNQPLFLITD